MISVNTNDTVQHSEVTFDHICIILYRPLRSMYKFLLMAGECIVLYATIVLKLHEACISVWKEFYCNSTVAHWYHFQHFSRIFVYATFSFCLRDFFFRLRNFFLFVYAAFFHLTCCSIRSSVQCYSALQTRSILHSTPAME